LQIVKHLKELGCVVKRLPKAEAELLFGKESAAKDTHHVATLVAPLVFPALRKKQR